MLNNKSSILISNCNYNFVIINIFVVTRMGCFVKLIGRLLFVTLLISSAYLHLSKPQNFTEDLSNNYSQVVECAKHLPGYLPPVSTVFTYLMKDQLDPFQQNFGSFRRIDSNLNRFRRLLGSIFPFGQLARFWSFWLSRHSINHTMERKQTTLSKFPLISVRQIHFLRWCSTCLDVM